MAAQCCMARVRAARGAAVARFGARGTTYRVFSRELVCSGVSQIRRAYRVRWRHFMYGRLHFILSSVSDVNCSIWFAYGVGCGPLRAVLSYVPFCKTRRWLGRQDDAVAHRFRLRDAAALSPTKRKQRRNLTWIVRDNSLFRRVKHL